MAKGRSPMHVNVQIASRLPRPRHDGAGSSVLRLRDYAPRHARRSTVRGTRIGKIRHLMLGTLLLIWMPATASAHDQPAAATASDWGATETEATRFRAEFGLRADPDFVRGTFQDQVEYSSDWFGVPLSKSEHVEMFRRASIQTAMDEAIAIARTDPSFSGAYLDQQNRGRPVFMFAATNPAIRAELEALFPVDADMQIEQAVRTEQELHETRSLMKRHRDALEAGGIQIVQIAIATSMNTLHVGVRNLTSGAAGVLKELYGSDLSVVDADVAVSDACNDTNNCRPMKGGISINHTGGVPGECTAGYVVKRTDNGNPMILTAGHCIQVHGGFDQAWQHNSQGFGRAQYETWIPGGSGDADVGVISIQSPEWPSMTSKNLIRRKNGTGSLSDQSVAQVTGLASVVQGGQACRVGRASGHDCGIIKFADEDNWSIVPGWQWMNVLHTARVSFDSTGGDSGGPVFYYPGGGTCCNPVTALGTHVHSEADSSSIDEGWFSPYGWGRLNYDNLPQAAYTYTICLSASC